MPSQEHNDLMQELRSTRSVRASMLTLTNSIHQRLKVALESNSGHGDFAALRALLEDTSPTHRDALADSLIHGTSLAGEDKDADPTAPEPASNPASLGGNVYGSKGPEDTDTNRDGGVGGNRKELSQPEKDARDRQALGAEARNREEREKNENNLQHDSNAPNSQADLKPRYGTKSDPNDPHDGDVTSTGRPAGTVQEQARQGSIHDHDALDSAPARSTMMHMGSGDVSQQDRPAGARETGEGHSHERVSGT